MLDPLIILAALMGGLSPFCSCAVIPFIAGLLALGTPIAPVMARTEAVRESASSPFDGSAASRPWKRSSR